MQEPYAYTAFGVSSVLAPDYSSRSASSFDWEFRFHGQFEDEETGWQNYGYRFYVPELGRWINRDPAGEEEALNLYAFVANGSMNGNDFLGMERTCCPNCDNSCGLNKLACQACLRREGCDAELARLSRIPAQDWQPDPLASRTSWQTQEGGAPNPFGGRHGLPDDGGVNVQRNGGGGFGTGVVVLNAPESGLIGEALMGLDNLLTRATGGAIGFRDISDFAAGFGDHLSLGATSAFRSATGTNAVNTSSSAYQGGGIAGYAFDALTIGASGGLRALARLNPGGKAAARNAAKSLSESLGPGITPHHTLPVGGHPSNIHKVLGGWARPISGARTYFPSSGLGRRANAFTTPVPTGPRSAGYLSPQHAWAHARTFAAERIAYWGSLIRIPGNATR